MSDREEMPMMRDARRDWIWKHMGGSFVERELHNASRWVMAASLIVFLIVAFNVGYFLYLLGLAEEFGAYLSSSDRAFVKQGWSALAGSMDLQVMSVLMATFFLGAPTLACLTVGREMQARTMDSLVTTPISPLGIHNGFVFGALAKVVPWTIPALALHLVLGLTGGVALWVTLESLFLLFLGGWGLTSLGAMLGVAGHNRLKGPAGGLLVFAAMAAFVGLPIFALFGIGEEYLSMLSPASAILNSILTSGNAWLAGVEFGPELFYSSNFMGLSIYPPLVAGFLMLIGGVTSTHVASRKISDPLAPAMDWRVGVGSLGALLVVASLVVVQNTGSVRYAWGEGGRPLAQMQILLNFLSFPVAYLFAAQSMASSKFLERAGLWKATRPSDLGARKLPLRGSVVFWMMALLPVGASFVLPFLHSSIQDPIGVMSSREYARAAWGFLPLLWGMAGLLGLLKIWRGTDQRGWKSSVFLLAVILQAVLGAAYTVVAVEQMTLRLRDFAWESDVLGLVVGGLFLLGFVAAPPVLWAWSKLREKRLSMRLIERAGYVVREEEDAPEESFRWPEAAVVHDELLCSLRSPWKSGAHSPRNWFAGEKEGGASAREFWLALHESSLSLWEGSARERREARVMDLSRPFHTHLTLQPEKHYGPGSMALVHVTLVAREGGEKIAFSLPVRFDASLQQLDKQEQVLPRVGPREAQKVLASIRYYAEANGTPLQRVFADSSVVMPEIAEEEIVGVAMAQEVTA